MNRLLHAITVGALLVAASSLAQTTTITATIPTYANGVAIATFNPGGGGTPFPRSVQVSIASDGSISLPGWNNQTGQFAPSTTTVNICAGSAPSICYQTTFQAKGATEDITAFLANAPIPPTTSGGVYPPGNGIPTVNTGGTAWSVTIPQIPIANYGAAGYSSYAAAVAGTDSTTAIQNCINALEAGPTTGQCFGEAKWYKITAPIVINTAGVGFAGTYGSTVGVSPNVTSIISTSASADIFTVQGPNIGAQINANKFNDFQIGRSVQPTGTAKGMDFIYTNFARVENVTSNDSLFDWYFHGNSAGYFVHDAGLWGLISPVESGAGPYYGFYYDSANGEPNNSMQLYQSGANGGPGTGTYVGKSSQGTAINDFWAVNFSSSNATIGVEDIYSGSGATGTCNDIHYINSIIDQPKTSAYLIQGLSPSCNGAVEITGGHALSFQSGSIAIDLENTSGTTVEAVQIAGNSIGVKLGGTSTLNSIQGNTFGKGNGTTGISVSTASFPNTTFPNQFDSTITTPIADSTSNGGLTTAPFYQTTNEVVFNSQCSNVANCLFGIYNTTSKQWFIGVNGSGSPNPGAVFWLDAADGTIPITLTPQGQLGIAAAPTGACSPDGTWVFSQDGHASVCDSGTHLWVVKL